MEPKNDLLRGLRGILRLYDRDCQPVCEQYGLTRCELDVLGFLANHPGLDTARDITELRLVPKANVSQAVESLIRKELLVRAQDTADRRLIHLTPTSEADGAIWVPVSTDSMNCAASMVFMSS